MKTENILQECERLLYLLKDRFNIQPSNEVLKDLLFNFGTDTKNKALVPLRELYKNLGEENIFTTESSMSAAVKELIPIVSAFWAVPLEISSKMVFENGTVKIKTE